AFDLQRVLETLLENAVRICGAKHGMIFRYDGDCCRAAATYNAPPGAPGALAAHPNSCRAGNHDGPRPAGVPSSPDSRRPSGPRIRFPGSAKTAGPSDRAGCVDARWRTARHNRAWKTEKPPAAIGERTQVAVRLQRQPRAAHAAQRHHWTDRDD